MRGVSSSMDMPQSGQEYFSEKISSSLPITSTFARPSPKAKAVSMDSARRPSMPGFMMSLSTITSMVCFFCLSRGGTSFMSYTSPSIRTRT